jgi:Flp pilus assembly pilin Flp
MRSLLGFFVREDEGQDLIEYALIAAFLALVSVAAIGVFRSAIGTTYTSWNTNNNNNWEMPAPGGGS